MWRSDIEADESSERKNYFPPCKTMEKVNFEWLENLIETDNDTKTTKVGNFWFSIGFDLRTGFKELIHTRYSNNNRINIRFHFY